MATVTGTSGNDRLVGTAGNDTINGLGGNDTIVGGSGGSDVIDGGAGFDAIEFGSAATSAIVVDFRTGSITGGGTGGISFTGIERVVGSNFNDILTGNASGQNLTGQAGADTIWGAGGIDTLWGGGGAGDTFIFRETGIANADLISDFTSGVDKIQLDAAVMTALGASGNFAAGDGRFWAAAGATGGHDADDRIIYDTTTRKIYYDADGSGAGLAQLIATLQSGATLAATDIVVEGGSSGGGGTVINGTSGNDSLTGTPGNDTINGLGGDDTINGMGGSDSLTGGAGNDSLIGGVGDDLPDNAPGDRLVGGDGDDTLDGADHHGSLVADTMDGGLGNDEFRIDHPGDVLSDAGGVDTVIAQDMDWTLAAGFENLTLRNDLSESGYTGIGNELNNRMAVTYAGSRLEGRGGNDTLIGSGNEDVLFGGDGDDSVDGGWDYDLLDGGAGNDTLEGGGDDNDDTLIGGAGSDTFYIRNQFNIVAERINDFASGSDVVQFDGRDFSALGPSGRFSAGDPRFHAAPGATGGHDPDDRLVYDPTSGQLFYDSDGSGSAAAEVVVRFPAGTALSATDMVVVNGTGAAGGTAGNDSLVGGSGNDYLSGFGGNDTLVGLAGHDTLDGGTGADRMEGGADNDSYIVDNPGDITVEANEGTGGLDVVHASLSWTLASSVEYLYLEEGASAAIRGTGNAGYNWIYGNSLNNVLEGGGGQDELHGLAGDDTLRAGDTYSYLYGEDGNDLLIATFGLVNGGSGNDRIEGGNSLSGDDGNDTIVSGVGTSEISGGPGADVFVFQQAEKWVRYLDFTSGSDLLRFDARVFTNLGASGTFAAGDERFYSGAGARAAHDATDRLIYDTSTGDLFYDPDGSGSAAAVTVATLRHWFSGAPVATLQATDIEVVNGSAAGGQLITGTSGNDSLQGGPGDDTLDGGAGSDTMNGGLGNDLYIVTTGDVLSDPGGVDTVQTAVNWSLGADFENLTMTGTSALQMQGNNSANFVIGNSAGNYFNARAGADTIQAGGGNDNIDMSSGGTGNHGNDVIDGGAGFDNIDYDGYATRGIVANWTTGTISGGDAVGSTVSFTSVEAIIGGAFADQMTGNASGQNLTGKGGNDTLWGAGGSDTLWGGTGADSFVFREMGMAGGGVSNADRIGDFASGSDKIALDDSAFLAIGATGNFAAGDGRFWAAAGATSGHDANDRVVYNTTTGSLYYDADGSGAGAAQLIATFTGNPAIAATDITVI